jgi:hypothetical protein
MARRTVRGLASIPSGPWRGGGGGPEDPGGRSRRKLPLWAKHFIGQCVYEIPTFTKLDAPAPPKPSLQIQMNCYTESRLFPQINCSVILPSMKPRSHKPASPTVSGVPHKAPVSQDPMAERPKAPDGHKRASSRDRAVSANPLTLDKGRPRIRYQIPSVARYVARVIIKNAMDYELAVEEIAGGSMDAISIREIASNMQSSPEIQAAIENELTIHGLDEKSKDAFVHEMWDWLRGDSEEKAKKAAGILGRGFIAEHINVDKPETLAIDGLEDAVNSMLGSPPAPKVKDNDPIVN